MIIFSATINFLIVFSIMWIMRQIRYGTSMFSLAFRLVLMAIALPYLAKVVERLIHHDMPSFVDVWRDSSVLGLFILVIYFHSNKFKRI